MNIKDIQEHLGQTTALIFLTRLTLNQTHTNTETMFTSFGSFNNCKTAVRSAWQ